MQKKISLMLSMASLAFASASHANTSSWRPVAAFTVGGAFSSDLGQSEYFPATATSFSFYDYNPEDATQGSYMIGGFLGAEFVLSAHWLLQTGVAYYALQPFDVKGMVTQGVDAASADQYSYQYSIRNSQLLLENKILYHVQRYNPYFLIGLGVAWNRSEDFKVNIEPAFTAFSNQFPSNTESSFTYDIGVGVDVDLTKNARIGLGYRFTDFGSAKTGKANIDSTATDNVLSQSSLYAQEILLQLTVLY